MDAGLIYYFRIVRTEQPTSADFESAAMLGKPLLDRRYEREWRESVSVYDDLLRLVDGPTVPIGE